MPNTLRDEVIQDGASAAGEHALNRLPELINESSDSPVDYNIFPRWISRHLPDFGISTAAKKYLYNGYQAASAASFSTIVGLLLTGTIMSAGWYVVLGILGLTILYALYNACLETFLPLLCAYPKIKQAT